MFVSDIFVNNNEINKVKEVCLLGVMLDENLSWKAHISHVAHKISKSTGLIYRSSFYLFKKALRILYFALAYPYIFNINCITIWRSTYSTNLNRIVVLLFYKNVCYESLINRTSVCIPVLFLMNLKY
jgi:hypothetical protein